MKKQLTAFQQVAVDLRGRIRNGQYQPGQKLPSEYELAESFQVSRLTVRKAVAALIDEHLLAKEPGRGTYVMRPGKISSGSGGLQGFTEKARQEGRQPGTKVLSCEEASVIPEKVRTFFGEESVGGQVEPLLHISRLRYLEGEPMTVEDLYLPKRYLPDVSDELLEGSLFQELEKQVEIGYSHQEVEAVLVDDQLAALLQVADGAPLLLVHSLTYSPAGRPVLYDTSFYRADKYTFRNTLQRKRYR